MKDEDNDKVGKIIEKAVDKVKIWKESANMKMSIKKEISHLELTRHKVEFEDPAHDVNRSGLELMQKLNGEDFAHKEKRINVKLY